MSHPHSRRRSFTVRKHELFINSLLTPADLDEIDEIDAAIDEHLQIDPFNGDPPSKRKDAEFNRVLALLDSLEGGTR